MVFTLICLIGLLSAMQKKHCDRVAACIFSVQAVVGYYTPDLFYYHTCGAVALLAMVGILKIKSRLSITLSKMLFLSILINMFGCIMWYNYKPPSMYNSFFILYYFVAFHLLISRGQLIGLPGIRFGNRLFCGSTHLCVDKDNGGKECKRA